MCQVVFTCGSGRFVLCLQKTLIKSLLCMWPVRGWAGLNWAGLDWTGLDRTGPGWTGLDWAGLGWTGLDQVGLGWTGLGWTGLDWARPGQQGGPSLLSQSLSALQLYPVVRFWFHIIHQQSSILKSKMWGRPDETLQGPPHPLLFSPLHGFQTDFSESHL